MFRKFIGATVLVISLAAAGSAQAVISHNQNVSPDVIFGTDNANGAFTVDRTGGVELGLRAKIPFVGTTNSNGDGTFSFTVAEQETAPDAGSCPAIGGCWNFEWTINTDTSGQTGINIDGFTYELGIDIDPSAATNFVLFDPVTPGVSAPFFDHSIGDNSTANGGGAEATDAATYNALIANNNVLQQSWRHAFFPIPYDPTISGIYDISLRALDGSTEVSSVQIQVNVSAAVPEPGTLALFGLGLAGLGFARRRKIA